jgi:hypothetical protein
MFPMGLGHQIHADALIERHESSTMGHSEGEQMAVGDLTGARSRSERIRPALSRLISSGQN